MTNKFETELLSHRLDHARSVVVDNPGYPVGVVALALILVFCGWSLPAGAVPVLSTDTEEATAGFFRLSWEADTVNVRLERAAGEDFAAPETVYEGPDRARVLSGEPNGVWHFRVVGLRDGGPATTSEPITVTVRHHPLSRAILFFAIGAVVFLSTLALIVHGARENRHV